VLWLDQKCKDNDNEFDGELSEQEGRLSLKYFFGLPVLTMVCSKGKAVGKERAIGKEKAVGTSYSAGAMLIFSVSFQIDQMFRRTFLLLVRRRLLVRGTLNRCCTNLFRPSACCTNSIPNCALPTNSIPFNDNSTTTLPPIAKWRIPFHT
jgi:hypothetical protein